MRAIFLWAWQFRVQYVGFSIGGSDREIEGPLCRRVVFLDKKLYFTLSLFTQVYKWVPVNRTNFLGLPCDGFRSVSSGGGGGGGEGGNSNAPSLFMLGTL